MKTAGMHLYELVWTLSEELKNVAIDGGVLKALLQSNVMTNFFLAVN